MRVVARRVHDLANDEFMAKLVHMNENVQVRGKRGKTIAQISNTDKTIAVERRGVFHKLKSR